MNQRSNLNDVKDILELVKIKIERNEEYFQKNKGITPKGAQLPINENNEGFRAMNGATPKMTSSLIDSGKKVSNKFDK